MKPIKIFYIDKFGREVAYICQEKEFKKFIYDFLEENIDKGYKLYYTYNNEVRDLDYYNVDNLLKRIKC